MRVFWALHSGGGAAVQRGDSSTEHSTVTQQANQERVWCKDRGYKATFVAFSFLDSFSPIRTVACFLPGNSRLKSILLGLSSMTTGGLLLFPPIVALCSLWHWELLSRRLPQWADRVVTEECKLGLGKDILD